MGDKAISDELVETVDMGSSQGIGMQAVND